MGEPTYFNKLKLDLIAVSAGLIAISILLRRERHFVLMLVITENAKICLDRQKTDSNFVEGVFFHNFAWNMYIPNFEQCTDKTLIKYMNCWWQSCFLAFCDYDVIRKFRPRCTVGCIEDLWFNIPWHCLVSFLHSIFLAGKI